MTIWNEGRLNRLFKCYNRLYWNERLQGWRVTIGNCGGAYGWCMKRSQLITIDVDAHPNDREVPATLLHEMTHAATGNAGGGHGLPFFAQLERLLRARAPITINNPEAGAAHILKDIVPARFPLLKRKMDRAEALRQKSVEQTVRVKQVSVTTISDENVICDFEEAATQLTWKPALLCVGLENGLVDEGGRPVNQWARRLVIRARKAHSRARRDFLDGQKYRDHVLRGTSD